MSTPAEQQVETEPKPVHQPEGDQPSNQELSASDELDESGDPLELVESRPENYPHGIKLILLLMSLYCALFLVALDRTIIATALPQITDEFHSFADVGWVRLLVLLNDGLERLTAISRNSTTEPLPFQ